MVTLVRAACVAAMVLALAGGDGADSAAPSLVGSADDALLVRDPATLHALEERGFSFGRVVHAEGESGHALGSSPLYGSMVATLSGDLGELARRPGVGDESAVQTRNHPFRASWLTDRRSHFELVGLVNRLDRRDLAPADASRAGCGETRLVYRLALTPRGRPPTRLPMTVSVAFPQPRANGSCAETAQAWLRIPRAGRARLDALAARIEAGGAFAEVEANLQNLHGSPAEGQDDHSEYLLRGFVVAGGTLRPKPLRNTPRADLGPEDRARLVTFITEHFDEIDRGTARIPERFLALRAISVTPRGLARPENRVYGRLLADEPAVSAKLAALPYARAAVVRSPAALVRRLEESTCQGCHQTRALAGFHLLGEEREAAAFNALAVGASPHLLAELGWRRAALERDAAGAARDVAAPPEPFADHPTREGKEGAPCGLGDPGFASWSCAPGLRCRDDDGSETGVCASEGPGAAGSACEDARIVGSRGADGDAIAVQPAETCRSLTDAGASCGTAEYGFPGGMCAEECAHAGEVRGRHVCVGVPRSGYESDCFASREPIERCMKRHTVKTWLARCDGETPCRGGYACLRVPGTSGERFDEGACAPPYFVFQTRVDGPLLDR